MVTILTPQRRCCFRYLKEFRVEQCPLFLQHKCTQHRPFTCFHWHFMNQRRRRPVRRRDGTFNYSADNYCTKYDETTGICPDGDEWVHLFWLTGSVIFYVLWVWQFKQNITWFSYVAWNWTKSAPKFAKKPNNASVPRSIFDVMIGNCHLFIITLLFTQNKFHWKGGNNYAKAWHFDLLFWYLHVAKALYRNWV